MKNKEKFTRVFQMSFDIATADVANMEDEKNLFYEIDALIDTYNSIHGEDMGFMSVGCFNKEDMSHAYGQDIIDEMNE